MHTAGKTAVVVLIALALIGCGRQEQGGSRQTAVHETEDVIDTHGNVKNVGLLDAFVQGARDQVRVVRYTTEGDPLFYSLTKQDEGIEVSYDTSQDQFGSSSVKSYVCHSLQKNEANNGYAYVLNGCGGAGKNITLLEIRSE